MAEWISRGVYIVGLGILTSDYLTFHNSGIKNLSAARLRDGPGALSGGFSVVELPKGSPHPNAASVFVNWFAAQPGADIFARALGSPSRRVDVSVDEFPDFTVPRPGLSYQDQYTEDWFNERLPIMKEVLAAIGGR